MADWWVSNGGDCHPLATAPTQVPQPYRLYRFLSDLDDVLAHEPDDYERLRQICPRVRDLLTAATWLQLNFTQPAPQPGWSVTLLYSEPDFPLTIQNVVWLPGGKTPIHNHGTWGVVALVSGCERHRFWRRAPQPRYPHAIERVGECLLEPGDCIAFMPAAIHQVEVLGDEPSLSLNLYGETDFQRRFEFDPLQKTAQRF